MELDNLRGRWCIARDYPVPGLGVGAVLFCLYACSQHASVSPTSLIQSFCPSGPTVLVGLLSSSLPSAFVLLLG